MNRTIKFDGEQVTYGGTPINSENAYCFAKKLNCFCGTSGRIPYELSLLADAIRNEQIYKNDNYSGIKVSQARILKKTINDFNLCANALIDVLLQDDSNRETAKDHIEEMCPFWKESCKTKNCALWSHVGESCSLFLIGNALDAIQDQIEHDCISVANYD